MRLEISQVTRQLGITAVYVTHDQREALALSDAIAVMNHGRIVQFGTPEEIYRLPTDDFVARFVGYANAIPVQIVGGCARIEADGSVLTTPDVSLTGAATAFIHASAVVLEPAIANGPNRLPCTVADAAFMGDHVEYVLRQEAGALVEGARPHRYANLRTRNECCGVLACGQADRGPADLVRTVPESEVPSSTKYCG